LVTQHFLSKQQCASAEISDIRKEPYWPSLISKAAQRQPTIRCKFHLKLNQNTQKSSKKIQPTWVCKIYLPIIIIKMTAAITPMMIII
jgi:hypothetical protein